MKVFWIAHNLVDRLSGPECIVDVLAKNPDLKTYPTVVESGQVESAIAVDRIAFVFSGKGDIEQEVLRRTAIVETDTGKADPVADLQVKIDALPTDKRAALISKYETATVRAK